MNIEVLKDLKIFDAGSKSGVDELIKKINIDTNEVVLNLSRCIIDYPATSRIIDTILAGLQKQAKPRRFVIQTHLNIIETLLMHWLFIGSTFLKIDDSKKRITVDEFVNTVNKNLSLIKVSITIQVLNKEDKIIKEYNYGK